MGAEKYNWHGYDGYVLNSSRLRVVVVPELGGKIVSLLDKPSSHEWLLQPSQEPKRANYGSSFVSAGLYGWDEMCPTIDACSYPFQGQYAGTMLPDHGDVWSVPWKTFAVSSKKIGLQVWGTVLPFVLTRTLRLFDDSTLSFHYELKNQQQQPLAIFWAAHPLFACNEWTQVLLPKNVHEVVCTNHSDPTYSIGACVPWPTVIGSTGETQSLDRIGSAGKRSFRKFFVPPDQAISTASILQYEKGIELSLKWTESVVPYLGIWIDEGAFADQSNVALEPMTGYFDALDTCYHNGHITLLQPGEVRGWNLRVRSGVVRT